MVAPIPLKTFLSLALTDVTYGDRYVYGWLGALHVGARL
jgi:hypothetical protein